MHVVCMGGCIYRTYEAEGARCESHVEFFPFTPFLAIIYYQMVCPFEQVDQSSIVPPPKITSMHSAPLYAADREQIKPMLSTTVSYYTASVSPSHS
jgi:hypothetical protein